MKRSTKRKLWIAGGIVGGVLFVFVLAYVARTQLWPAYREWRIGSLNRMAEELIAAGDGPNALLLIRRNLSDRPNDLTTSKLGVRAALLRDSVSALSFQANVARLEPTPENAVQMLRLALRFRSMVMVKELVDDPENIASQHPDYHELAAAYHAEIGQPALAVPHLVSLSRLRPNDKQVDLSLAEMELLAERNVMPDEWRAKVRGLATDPNLARIARLLLLREALVRNAAEDALAAADALVSEAHLRVSDRLLVLRAFQLHSPDQFQAKFDAFIEEVNAVPAQTSVALAGLIDMLRLPAQVEKWFEDLPSELQSQEAIRLQLGRALFAQEKWSPMLSSLVGSPWATNEELRLTYLAAAHRGLGNVREAADLWRSAVISVSQDQRRLRRLESLIVPWGWRDERYALVWELFNLNPSDVALRDDLISYELRRGNTANVNKIFARLLQVSPEDRVIRNNFAYTSLLLDTNVVSAHLYAREVFLENSENPVFKTTYALALYRQGSVQEAWDMMESMSMRERPLPARIALHAFFSSRLGKARLAQDLLNDLVVADLMPEEQRLIQQARLEMARANANLGKEQTLAALGERPAESTQLGWLALLPNGGPDQPTVDMRLADSHYANGDFEALRALLADGRWENADHLRVALLSKSERQRSANSAANGLWRQALVIASLSPTALRDLLALASAWQWQEERMDVLSRIYERDPENNDTLTELLDHYRRLARTHEMARVLWLRLGRLSEPERSPDASRYVYYSFLARVDMANGHSLAKRAYDIEANHSNIAIYSMSLWLQGRRQEARALLDPVQTDAVGPISISLLQAILLSEAGEHAPALAKLEVFRPERALPEEIALAARVRRAAELAASATP